LLLVKNKIPHCSIAAFAASFSIMHRAPAAMVTKTVEDPNTKIKTPRDPNTLSNYHNYVTKHTSVDFEIDFEKKRLVGKVELKMESLTDEEVDIVLDSR
jgi:leukotriene-A4 hydrolase